jgi:hypothetical protein
MSGEAVWGFKLLLFLAEVLTIVVLWRLTLELEIPAASTLLYALCPLPIIQFSYDAHLDGLGIALLTAALLSGVQRRRVVSLLLLGISLTVKPVGLVLLPLLVLTEKRWTARLATIVLPFIPALIQFIPYIVSSNPFEGLETFSRHWTFNGVVFETLNALLLDNLTARLFCLAFLLVALAVLLRSRRNPMDTLYYAVLSLLLLSPVVHPWYVCWLVLFLPIVEKWSGVIFAATASLTVLTVVQYTATGVWDQHPLVLFGEYGPVFALLGWELRTHRTSAPST